MWTSEKEVLTKEVRLSSQFRNVIIHIYQYFLGGETDFIIKFQNFNWL